jgi:hypothetical protein
VGHRPAVTKDKLRQARQKVVTAFERGGVVEYAMANDTEEILIDRCREDLNRKLHSQLKLALSS